MEFGHGYGVKSNQDKINRYEYAGGRRDTIGGVDIEYANILPQVGVRPVMPHRGNRQPLESILAD